MKQPLFQQYQAAFNAHLRDPAQQPKPQGANAKRIGIYREIVFNNFLASVSACFPVLLSILGKRRFKQLTRQCFASHHFCSPLFSDIPKALIDYLQTLDLAQHNLPSYALALAHYEWVELYLTKLSDFAKLPDNSQPITPVADIRQASDLAEAIVRLPAAHMLLNYDYPVHQLSKKHANLAAKSTYLLVFLINDCKVEFIQLNEITYVLLQRIQSEQTTLMHHLTQLAQEMLPHLPLQRVLEFGSETLFTLYLQRAIVIKK
ncbi:MAG: HvfC family RiPP maturation protein [Methylophilus sp.]|uniref:HvfC family RiPP maturation protein n=1 Tax=Methylophilus sp. TaxID=29541 RepID=UPI003FA11F94